MTVDDKFSTSQEATSHVTDVLELRLEAGTEKEKMEGREKTQVIYDIPGLKECSGGVQRPKFHWSMNGIQNSEAAANSVRKLSFLLDKLHVRFMFTR